MVRVKYSDREGGGLVSIPFGYQDGNSLGWVRVEIIPIINGKRKEFQYAISKRGEFNWDKPEVKGQVQTLPYAKTMGKRELIKLGVFFKDEVRRKKKK